MIITGLSTLVPSSKVTVTVCVCVVVLPAASLARAVSVCTPLVTVVVFQTQLYGEVVSSEQRFTPSSLNWTPATATLSEAFAETVTVPVVVALFAGAVIETVGAVVSAVTVAEASFEAGPTLPAPSSAVTL